ncbi:hypothetical protein BX600DRAFT_44690 [Xylariales sp. PMI_506]|nr:hypothetical protein BX600DRAFT_44690 [Xylariales sp. PMI_506]
MKLSHTFLTATALSQCVGAVAVPNLHNVGLESRTEESRSYSDRAFWEDLQKRKGGGGKGGSSGSGSSGSSGSSSSSGSSGSSGSSAGRGSSSSNTGGSTTTGSGPKPAYGSSGSYYGGGSTTPYRAGSTSPSGIVPGVLIGSSLGFWGGSYWALGAYSYPYAHPYVFHNVTTNQNETKPVECLCRQDQECGCDDNTDTTYLSSVIGNGSYAGLNQTLVTVAAINGTDTILINGTLPNGTTASGGTDSPNGVGGMQSILQAMGWWPIATTVLALAYVS